MTCSSSKQRKSPILILKFSNRTNTEAVGSRFYPGYSAIHTPVKNKKLGIFSNNDNVEEDEEGEDSSKLMIMKMKKTLASRLLDGQIKGGYSAIHTPVKNKKVSVNNDNVEEDEEGEDSSKVMMMKMKKTLASRLLDGQIKGGYSVIHTPVKNKKLGVHDDNVEEGEEEEHDSFVKTTTPTLSTAMVVVTPATNTTMGIASAPPPRIVSTPRPRQQHVVVGRMLDLPHLSSPQQSSWSFKDEEEAVTSKPSLSVNARMGAICCITPAPAVHNSSEDEETKLTFDFGTRATLMTTDAKSNEVVEQGDMLVAEFEKEMERSIKLETAQTEVVLERARVDSIEKEVMERGRGGSIGGRLALLAEFEKEMDCIELEMAQAKGEERRVQMEKSLRKAQDEIKILKLQLQREREEAEKENLDTQWKLYCMTRRKKDLEENMQTTLTLRANELNEQAKHALELVRRQAEDLEEEEQEFENLFHLFEAFPFELLDPYSLLTICLRGGSRGRL
jgi:hypothetical protein